VCNRGLSTAAGLRDHIARRHTSREDFKFQCKHEDCSKKFPTKKALKQHLDSHNNTKEYECPYCSNAAYQNRSGLYSHVMRKHKADHKIKNLSLKPEKSPPVSSEETPSPTKKRRRR
jgi:uncharacterized Zn-finger protein